MIRKLLLPLLLLLLRFTTPAPTTTAAAAAAAAAAAPLMEPLQIRHANLLVAGLATCQMLMGLCLGGITATKP